MNRILIFFIAFFSYSLGYSQQIKLEWNGSTIVDYGTEKINVPFFKNEGYNYDGVNISYSQYYSDGKRYKAENLIWEKIQQKDLFELSDMYLQEATQGDFISSPIVNKNNITGILQIKTFKRETDGLYRLISFNIVQDNTPVSQSIPSKLGTTENPLKSGTFYKIRVDKSGIFKITAKFLRDNGINPSNIDPKNFRIYGNGGIALPEYNLDARFDALQENAIQIVGEDDGVWNDNDYAIFYAQGSNAFNIYPGFGNGKKRKESRTDKPFNFQNVYDNYAYYFINFDLGPGKRVQQTDVTPTGNVITRYDAYQYLNEEKNNLMKVGRTWVGDSFIDTKTITFTTNSPIQTADKIYFKSSVVAYQSNKNSIETKFFDQSQSQSIPDNSSNEFYNTFFSGSVTNVSGNQLTFTYSPSISANPNGRFYLDYVEVLYKEDLKYNGNQMNFRDYSIKTGNGEAFNFKLSNTGGLEQIWEVSDITNATQKVNKSTGSEFSFGYIASDPNFNNEFVAFNNAAAFSPEFVGKVENQDLSGLHNIQYLMITSPEFLGQAQRLANFYQDKYQVAVVDVNKIYNEFSSGSKDITAIRDFATKLDNPTGTLKYIFLLGDTSFDMRGISYPGSDIIPAFQSYYSNDLSSSYVSDDYFGMTRPQNATISFVSLENIFPDIAVGRLPAQNLSEAKLLIDKTLAYNNSLPGQSTPFGEWRMKMDFVVDDDDSNEGNSGGKPFHKEIEKALFATFESGKRKEYNIRKLYLDAFKAEVSAGGQRYPQINQAISNDIGNSLSLFYFGHGGINGWAQERIMNLEDIDNFNNYNNVYTRFPFVSTITCEFTLWDNPTVFSAGEQFIKNKNGGASAMITSSRKIGIDYGINISNIFIANLYDLNSNNDFLNIGDSYLLTKQDPIAFGKDHTLRINLLGDPASKLSRPQQLITIDQIQTPIDGQIRALDFVKISGHINKTDGSADNTFNGRVVINVFDKKMDKFTLNNDNNSDFNPPMKFKEEGSPIVKASGTVVNGVFTVEFYVPKDINYEIGTGRILAYADNKVFDVYENLDQKVGGINPEGINDNTPPNVNVYMNNINFAPGGITDQNPMLLACVTDDKGINSTGSGIGHDIVTYLDGEIVNTVVLNDFYFSGEGNGCVNPSLSDYQKGVVTYPFRNLKPGEHQLSFKVWDINNNSTTETLNFIVKDETDQHLTINRLLNWPNPFTNKTYIQFEHNCDDILDVNVQIYTITGRLVRTLTTNVSAEAFLEGFRTPRTAIEWDGKDDFGDTVAKGTYIFKVFARSQNQEKCKGSASAVEKMVVLK